MAQRLIDVEAANLDLFNMLFRNQVYLEGVKIGLAADFSNLLREIYGKFFVMFNRSKWNSVDELSRVQLQTFIRQLQEIQKQAFNKYTQRFIELLKELASIEHDFANVMFSKSYFSRGLPTISDATLWALLNTSVVPASGLTINQMFANFNANSSVRIASQIGMSSVDGNSMNDSFDAICGTNANNFKDGLFYKFTVQDAALISTAVQQVSQVVQENIAKEMFPFYQWVSVMDNKTSEICIERNGNVYEYDKGPRPPAHYRCRSKEVPLYTNQPVTSSSKNLSEWFSTQPVEFLKDAFGMSHGLTEDSSPLPLTVSNYKSKIKLIAM